jgi:hypothetical protein
MKGWWRETGDAWRRVLKLLGEYYGGSAAFYREAWEDRDLLLIVGLVCLDVATTLMVLAVLALCALVIAVIVVGLTS